jgi:orotate phosphoribosyltransferase
VVGAPLRGRVVIIDDVISAGTSVRESVELIRAQGATPSAVLIALDRQERGGTAEAPGPTSATQEVAALYGIPVLSIASLDDLFGFLQNDAQLGEHLPAITEYRRRYGVSR